jgi:uncharacterized protein DUF6448
MFPCNWRWQRILILAGILLFAPTFALAHCDGMDGPVVKAAQKALQTGDVNLVLIWVQKNDEAELQKAFAQTITVRKLGPEAKALADRYFFETLVRLHRAGEGAPYTGLKPAGRDLGPAIPAADKALAEHNVEPLLKLITSASKNGLQEHFRGTTERGDFKTTDVKAGRAYVKAYVEFVHYVERLYEAATKPVSGHEPEPSETKTHEE